MAGPARSAARAIGTVAAGLVAVWLGGFLWFAAHLPRAIGDPVSRTDGIVVLTGGSDRLAAGLALLAAGHAGKMFVSGVDPTTDRTALKALAPESAALFDCCVEIGRLAQDTAGNAREARDWAARESIVSLRLVTASYHMPRSLNEFRKHMPDTALIPHPVFPDRVKLEQWWAWPGTTALIAGEFNKYLVSLIRGRLFD